VKAAHVRSRRGRVSWLAVLAAVTCLAVFATAAGCGTTNQSDRPARLRLSQAMIDRAGGEPSITVVTPTNGAVVTSPVQMVVELAHFRPEPAGATTDGAGHLHVMIDRPCLATGDPIPKDDEHVHFGSGAVEFELELEPGTHELCVQIGDGFHAAVDLIDTVTVHVEE